jgi:putative flippase GtrA
MTNPLRLTHRLVYFAIVGASSALIHILTVLGLVSYLQMKPIIANIFAFFIAFHISFLGHRKFTFAKLDNLKRLSGPHFFIVAASAGFINEILYFLLLHYTMLNYLLALITVLGFISIYSFLLSRFWACR